LVRIIFRSQLKKNNPTKIASSKKARRWLVKQAEADRAWILISVAIGLSSGILLIVQANFLARIVHSAFMEKGSMKEMWPYFVLLTGIIIFRAILSYAREVSGFYAGAKIRHKVRMALLEHIALIGPSFSSSQSTGGVAGTAIENVEGLHDFYAFYLPQLALAVMIPAAILTFIFPFSWAAGGLLLITAPLIPLFMLLVGMGAESISQKHFQALARMSAYFFDILQGLTTLKLYNRSKGTEKKIEAISKNYRRRTMGVLRVAFLSSAVLEFFSSISIALVAVYLGMSYLGYVSFGMYGNTLNLAGGLFILLLAPDFYLPLRELGTHYHARAEAVGAAEEILKILSLPRINDAGGCVVWQNQDPVHIRIENVYLAYDGGRRSAIRGVSFEINSGEQVAIVGASGAGKTTMLNLLLGFLQPDSGRILINNKALTDLTPDSWRKHIAWISQNPVLFHGTIMENILLGRPEATTIEVNLAARQARVLEFSELLPDGLETLIGEQGLGLSHGQAQRVALARAFLKDAPILFLDEPTAGLDVENESLIIGALERFSQGRTVLMLTHRLTNIQNADRIVVFDNGSIVEQGNYFELMAAGGEFQQLVSQAERRKNRG
jgi:ATP-binding cassette subfamily C protein CydD